MADVLYKFFPPERLTALQNRLVRFTPPEEFNDPFDIAPVAYYEGLQAGPTSGSSSGAFVELRGKLAELMQRQLDSIVNRPFLNQPLAANSRGVLCLTESSASLLMWAHYAASHKGFALGFDARHPWFAGARPVLYDPERPTVVVSLAGSRDEGEEYLYRKSDEWRYEREWRLVRPLVPRGKTVTAGLVRHLRNADEFLAAPPSLQSTLFKVPRDAVREVVVGARMSNADRTLLATHLASQPRLRITILECRLDPHAFRLQLDRVPRRRFLSRYGG